MSEIDYRYPYPFWVGTGRRARVYESRIIPPDWDRLSKDLLVISCINSIELLLAWQSGQGRIVWLLYRAMSMRGYAPSFDDTPQWMRLSRLTRFTLVAFKRVLVREIELQLITKIDVDPEEING